MFNTILKKVNANLLSLQVAYTQIQSQTTGMSDNVAPSLKPPFVGGSVQAVLCKNFRSIGSQGATNSKQPYQLKTSIK